MKKYLISILFITFFLPFFAFASDYSNGALLKANSDKVFVINNGFKHWIKNPAIFNSYGFDWGKITSVPQADLDKVSEMTLVKTSTSDKVYLLESDFRKWIPTAAIFEGKGYKWADIRLINETDFNSYQIGSDITADPTKYSDTLAVVFFTAIISNGSCLLNSPCPPSLQSLALTNNASLASLSFNVNPLGFEDAKLSKVVIKQTGSFLPEDYNDIQLVLDNKRFPAEVSGDTLTFVLDTILKGNISTNFYLTADLTALASGKYYQFRFESADIVGELSGLPIRYNSDILTSAVSISELKY